MIMTRKGNRKSIRKRLIWLTALAYISFRAAMTLVLFVGAAACQGGSAGLAGTQAPDSYESCVKAGGVIEYTAGVRCTTTSGIVFTQPKNASRPACKDLCGDGTCQEMVCMAVGCPCAESSETCAADCRQGARN